ncbi:profilin [Coprinopsis sp. MPI-PUGE-AT-0042]|nr:profilin [Coprinopsis sp. MPI-PUGE-AT-0042]
MSWQSYVDTNLVGTGMIAQAAILGLAKNGGVWAASEGFSLSNDEQNAIRDGFSKPDEVQAHGLRLAGVKYITLRVLEQSIYLKQLANGAAIVKTNQAILVAVYKEPVQAQEATPIVESLAQYLRDQKF